MNMLESICLTKNMDKESFNGQVVIITKENIKKTKEMGMVKCLGLMGVVILGNG